MIFYSEEIVVIFEYFIHNKRYIEDNWSQECVLALIFGNALGSKICIILKTDN